MLKLEIDPRTNKLGCAPTSCDTTSICIRGQLRYRLSCRWNLHFRFGTGSILYSTTALPCNIPTATGRAQPRLHKENSSLRLSLLNKRHMQRAASILWSCNAALKPTWHRIDGLERVRSVEKDTNAGSIASPCGSAALSYARTM